MLDAASSYFNSLKKSKPLTKEQEQQSSPETLVKCNLKLVVSIAKKFVGRGLDLEDLIQEGNTGLFEAANRYDPTKECKFSTYATHWILQAIKKAIADHGKEIRTPAYTNQIYNKIRTAETEANKELTSEELAKVTGESKEKIELLKNAFNVPPVSYEGLLETGQSEEVGDAYHTTTNQLDEMIVKDLQVDMKEALKILTEREQNIVSLRFGLEDGMNYSLKEIGNQYGITQERVRQIEERALKKLKKSFRTEHLKDYVD